MIDNTSTNFGNPDAKNRVVAYKYVRAARSLEYGRTHNIAIRRSVEKTKYYQICSANNSLLRNSLPTFKEYIDANKEVDRSVPRLLGADGDLQYCCRRYRVTWDYGCRLVFPKFPDKRRIR